MSAISYLTQLVQQAITKLNLIETNSKKIEELPFQTTLDPNSKIAVSRSGETEHLTVQQIISAVENVNYNHLISVGPISVDPITNEVTIGATVEALINNITVSKLTDTLSPTTLCAAGLIRKDYFFINELGEVLMVSGDEGAVATTPIIPLNTVYITEVLVTDAEVGDPSTPIVGDAFIAKKSLATYTFNGLGALVSIPFLPTGASFIKLTNPLLTSIAGFDFTLLTQQSQEPFEGKPIYLHNLTGNPVTIKHNELLNIEFSILLKDGVDLIIPNKEIIEFRFKNVEVEEVDRSWGDGVIETKNKRVVIGLNQLGISSFEDVTYEKISEFINLSMIVVGKGENYYFKIIEFVEEESEGLVIIDMTGS